MMKSEEAVGCGRFMQAGPGVMNDGNVRSGQVWKDCIMVQVSKS